MEWEWPRWPERDLEGRRACLMEEESELLRSDEA